MVDGPPAFVSTEGVVVAAGDVDLATAPALQDALVEMMANGTGDVIVDLERVPFIDSSGLNVFVRCAKSLGDGHGRRVVVRNPQPAVRRAIELGGLGTLVAIEESR